MESRETRYQQQKVKRVVWVYQGATGRWHTRYALAHFVGLEMYVCVLFETKRAWLRSTIVLFA